eukprot:jgi/Mesvir1/3709/Mv25521-RA.1
MIMAQSHLGHRCMQAHSIAECASSHRHQVLTQPSHTRMPSLILELAPHTHTLTLTSIGASTKPRMRTTAPHRACMPAPIHICHPPTIPYIVCQPLIPLSRHPLLSSMASRHTMGWWRMSPWCLVACKLRCSGDSACGLSGESFSLG